MMLTDMADDFRAIGLVVVEEPGWETRGGSWFDLVGFMQHHTACCMPYRVTKLYPTIPGQWRIKCNFSVQPGPDPWRDPARVHTVAAGYCNYSSGRGHGEVIRDLRNDIPPKQDAYRLGLYDTQTGSKHFVNNETAHPGDGSPLPAPMMEAIDGCWYALANRLQRSHNRLISHAEWTRRKIDPYWNGNRSHVVMTGMRHRLATNLSSGGIVLPFPEPIEEDQMIDAKDGPRSQAFADVQHGLIVNHGYEMKDRRGRPFTPFGPGYAPGADGYPGGVSHGIVIDFQTKRGLDPDGVVDGLTAAIINGGVASAA